MRVFFLLVSIFAALNVSAQEFIPYLRNGKYGFSTRAGKTIIKPQFDNVTEFGGSLYMKPDGSQKGLWGYPASVPGLGLAHVKMDSCWTIIDKSGNILVPCDSPSPLNINLLINETSIYYTAKKELELQHKLIIVNRISGKWWLYDMSTNTIGSKTYNYNSRRNFERLHKEGFEKCIIAEIIDDDISDLIERRTGKLLLEEVKNLYSRNKNIYTYYNPANEMVTYNYNDPAMEGVPFESIKKAFVTSYEYFGESRTSDFYLVNGWRPNSMGLSDSFYNILVDTSYEKVVVYPEHFVGSWREPVSREIFLDVYDHQGTKLDIPKCKSIEPFNEHFLIGVLESDKIIILDNAGRNINQEDYDYYERHNGKKYNLYQRGKHWGLLNTKGQKVVEYECDKFSLLQRSNDGPTHFLIERNGLFGVHSMDNDLIIPVKYKQIENTNHRDMLLLTNMKGKTGVSTNFGRIMIPLEYDKIESGHISYIQDNGYRDIKYHYIGFENGKEVAWFNDKLEPVSYSSVKVLRDKAPKKKSLTVECEGQKCKLLDRSGKVISDTIYNKIYA